MASNNPFALSPEHMAGQRYPDISHEFQGQQQQQQQQMQQQMPMQTGYGYGGGGYAQQQPQQQPQMYPQQTGYPQQQQGSGFQPSSQFGQYLQSQGTGLSFGAPQGTASTSAGSTAFYNPAPQPYNGTQYAQMTADLDPFSAHNRQQQSQPQYQQQQQQQLMTTPQQQETRQQEQYGEHPRAFMKNNKQALETWNVSAWGRVRSLFQQLEKAWEGRTTLVSEWQRWNLSMEDRDQCDSLRKEAESNRDMVAAYALQVKEVFDSYRHSSDASSRNQVRTALNQGLQTLPDWPLTLQAPPKLGDNGSQQPQRQQQDSLFYSSGSSQPQQPQPQPQYQYQQPQQLAQPQYQQQQQQQQPQYQQQPQMYVQQTGYQQPQQQQYGGGYSQQQQYPQQQQQFRQW